MVLLFLHAKVQLDFGRSLDAAFRTVLVSPDVIDGSEASNLEPITTSPSFLAAKLQADTALRVALVTAVAFYARRLKHAVCCE